MAKEFEEEKIKLKDILTDKVISIEHIGSTSVKGLAAKPIIDIALGVTELDAVIDFIEPLQKIGYVFVCHKEFPE
ncbi:GrpB family protein [Cytobacillus oceanisediminis]|uniref:GrpB family protein n=1 Tax=Cytobacillus oceanisediminis TaxID=665099 RepID=UPI0023DC4BD8|nr:GrpB family protein [Cytobacillus oceanisediminis]MDF2038350.1 GrpB family protein [Cytobacillus oceanisediminis]